jgi:hypothetical protein
LIIGSFSFIIFLLEFFFFLFAPFYFYFYLTYCFIIFSPFCLIFYRPFIFSFPFHLCFFSVFLAHVILGLFDTDSLGASALFFFCEAVPNGFLENGFTRETLEGRIYFLYYKGETKKVAPPTT